jgi:hypothetical protein
MEEREPEAQRSLSLLTPSEVVRALSKNPRHRNVFFEVRPSVLAGLGAFAVRDLALGDVILREKPLFISDNLNLYRDFEALDQQTKAVALSLHINDQTKPGTNPLLAVWSTNW